MRRMLAGLFLLLLGIAACGSAPTTNLVSPDMSTKALPACSTKPADCYAETQMTTYLSRAAGAELNGFFRNWVKEEGFEFTLAFIPAGQALPVGCRGDDPGDADQGFCDRTRTIYIGQKKLASLYGGGKSDLAAALMLAQLIAAAYPHKTDDPIEGLEYLASQYYRVSHCLAGAFLVDEIRARQAPAQKVADEAAIAMYRQELDKKERSAFDSGRKGDAKACGF